MRSEADLDVQWSGSSSQKRRHQVVVSASTPAFRGRATFPRFTIIEHNSRSGDDRSTANAKKKISPPAGNQFYKTSMATRPPQGITVWLFFLREMGAPQGVTRFQYYKKLPPRASPSAALLQHHTRLVGGTDFNEYNIWSTYWANTNDPTTHARSSPISQEIPGMKTALKQGLNKCGPNDEAIS